MKLLIVAVVAFGVLGVISAIKKGAPELAKDIAGKYAVVAGLGIGAAVAVRWLLLRAGMVALAGSAPWLAVAGVLVTTGAWNTIAGTFNGPRIGSRDMIAPGEDGDCPPGSMAYSADGGNTYQCFAIE